MCRGPETSKESAWAWGEGKLLGRAGKCSSDKGAWLRKLERGSRAVSPRTTMLGLHLVQESGEA